MGTSKEMMELDKEIERLQLDYSISEGHYALENRERAEAGLTGFGFRVIL